MTPRPLGLVSALPQELASVLALMPDEAAEDAASRRFWRGHLGGRPVVAVLSGIGKVAAATTATLLAERFGVEGVVFTGVAGGLGPGVSVGDVVVAGSCLQHDMDASPLFPRHEVPGYGRARFPADPELSTALMAAAQAELAEPQAFLSDVDRATFGLLRPRVHRGLLISGDRFVATAAESAALSQRLPDALAVDMESAALAQVCQDFGLPWAVIRTVSDRADDSAHVDFPRFLDAVARHYSARILARALSGLT